MTNFRKTNNNLLIFREIFSQSNPMLAKLENSQVIDEHRNEAFEQRRFAYHDISQ